MALLLLEVSEMQDGPVKVRACGGGMPPIYILRTGHKVEEIVIEGLPLGITAAATYKVAEFTLHSGDTMLLMSDGLVETFNAAGQYLSFGRLAEALTKVDTTLPTKSLLNQIAQIGKNWANGHPLYDDVTLVVTRVK
jgi:serine phosphatase RsbU (regulator of sigma subunit)